MALHDDGEIAAGPVMDVAKTLDQKDVTPGRDKNRKQKIKEPGSDEKKQQTKSYPRTF